MKINHKGENYLVNLVIYDIEAESHFEDLFAPFAEGSVAAMFVVDVTRVVTLDAIDDWVNRLRKVIKSTALNNAILIGNKIDLVGEVKKTDAERVVEKYKMIQYLETSAKENKNVDLAFQVFSERILQMTLES
jgi:GTPase SAR1 family protein